MPSVGTNESVFPVGSDCAIGQCPASIRDPYDKLGLAPVEHGAQWSSQWYACQVERSVES